MNLSLYPPSFFISAIVLILCAFYAWKHRREGWGLPMLAVLGTVAVWYHGDGLYNDYEEYQAVIGEDALNAAWWQVLLFVVTFAFLAAPIHRVINKRYQKKTSCLMLFAESDRIRNPVLQRQLDMIAQALLLAWIILMAIALHRKGYNFTGMFMPYLEGYKIKPWSRGRVGEGMSAILSLAGYLQIFMTAAFGVLAAVSTNPKTRLMAIVVCFLAFPYYIFDRVRNAMIATMLPGLLAWVFLRIRGKIWLKAAILFAAFLCVSFWFKFVVVTEMGRGATIDTALKQFGSKQEEQVIHGLEEDEQGAKHKGLSMFSELGYINSFIAAETYTPTWGKRYFAEVANVIPRGLWKNKPLVGVDYAIARGFGGERGTTEKGAGITASIATGMIGQGVVNFGRFFGPMCAALIMAVWVAVLARMDLMGHNPARLFLCVVGLILTFNMGRDITLFVLYPFVFGYMLIFAYEHWQKTKMQTAVPRQRA